MDYIQTLYFHRWFLVLSNLIALFPVVYCFIITHKYKIKWYTLLLEGAFCFATGFVSFLYHMCDSLDDQTKICVSDHSTLIRADFILSYQMLTVVACYIVDPRVIMYKFIFYAVTLISNSIFLSQYDYDPFNKIYYGLLVIFVIIVTCFRLLYLYKTDQLSRTLRYHFNIPIGLVAGICALVGIICKLSSTDEDYWFMHSLWHIFIFMAIFFEFMMYDIKICGKCRKECDCEECRPGLIGC